MRRATHLYWTHKEINNNNKEPVANATSAKNQAETEDVFKLFIFLEVVPTI